MHKSMAGSAIKASALILFVVGTLAVVFLALTAHPYLQTIQVSLGMGTGSSVWLLIIAIVLGVVVLGAFSLFIYAFGDLVDSSSCTALATEEVASKISELEEAILGIDDCARAAKATAGNTCIICRELERTNELLESLARRKPELNDATVPEVIDSPWNNRE